MALLFLGVTFSPSALTQPASASLKGKLDEGQAQGLVVDWKILRLLVERLGSDNQSFRLRVKIDQNECLLSPRLKTEQLNLGVNIELLRD